MHPAQVALHIGLLVASGALDAHSTRDLRARSLAAGQTFHESNPALRPFASSAAVYPAIIGADLAVYVGLRRLHRPKAAEWFWRV